jgi:hypothetical protein
MSILTDAHSRTLPKRNVCVFRSTAFVFFCETVWIELLRFWVVRWVKMDTWYRDINPGTAWKCYSSISIGGRQFVVAATLPFQKRNNRVFPLCLCEHNNNRMDVKYNWMGFWSFYSCEMKEFSLNSGYLWAFSETVCCEGFRVRVC